ncbi:nuclear pore complex DDB_G0274915-like [Lecanosticta acicola]|uniref:Nuclear pore complex DDB_G0274915-like n=1 Tax=Lecanosticta acicola TaxID=111012 RepID=A0AAI9EBB9_9PEZI|nr:nuclear pore complex DDB_G0274915-like [Lecanosticta acicola]
MALHKRHTHGRVFHGEAARELLAIRRRDSHGSTPVMNVPEGWEQQKSVEDSKDQAAQEVVYVTLSQTFSGPAIYSTITADSSATPVSASSATAATDDAQASYQAMKSAAQAGNQASASATSIATVTPQSSSRSSAAAATTLASVASAASSYAANAVAGTPLQATRSATASATSSPQGAISEDNSSLTPGAKAGLAIGILLAIGLAAALIFFCWRRKKATESHEESLNEKHGSFADAHARGIEAGGKRASNMTEKVPSSLRSTRTASTAPRLSLRPVTQFLPNLGEERKSGAHTPDAAADGEKRSAWEPSSNSPPQNPFDDATMLSEKQAQPESPPTSNPFEEPEGKKSTDSQQGPAAEKHNSKSSWEGSEAPTPKSAKFGTAAAVPMAAGGVAQSVGPRGPNNVHRVQLDFKPSMDDELELRSGQLVRMLHEYDDGWALCIRMDRSQQGVAPRTCLSKLPVKPRPQPPPGTAPRPGTAQGGRRPSNPPPPTPTNGAMYPRPLTPTQAQVQAQATTRSTSPTQANGEASTSPVGVPARKPVPGQAM